MSHYILYQFKDFKNLIKHQFTFLEKRFKYIHCVEANKLSKYRAGKIRYDKREGQSSFPFKKHIFMYLVPCPTRIQRF